jgi:acyl dehydratase
MSVPRFWEDFAPGFEIRSGARTITETDLVFWSGLAGDWNPAHVDVEHARTTPFGQRIAHGNIAFNLSVTLAAQAAPEYRPEGFVRLAGWERVRFTAPVFIGDTLHAERVLKACEDGPDGATGTLVYEVRMINQRQEAVMVATERMLVRRRPCGDEGAAQSGDEHGNAA